jgi:cell wall assembly regulator SMI1
VLAVVAAVVAVAAGIVVVVVTGRGTPAAGPLLTSSTTSAPPTPTLTVDSGCRTGAGPDELVDVPAQVTARVDAAWERIETWLAEHAPVSSAALRPPADDGSIVVAQRAAGVRFPAALVASLRRHDSADPEHAFTFPPFMHPLSAARIADEAEVMCDVLESVGIDGNVESWWHGRYLPVASDHGGDLLFLDGDRLGHHYEAGDVAFDGPAGLTELLEHTADALQGGGEYRPVVVDGELDWH